MIKKIVISFIALLLITGCGANKEENKIELTSKYYNGGNYLDIKSETLNDLESENYILYTYNPYCSFDIPCDEIFEVFMKKYKIDFLSIPFSEFKKTKFYDNIKYAPTVVIIEKGEIIAYLDANSDDDLDKYQKANAFESWMKKYIVLKNN